MTYNQHTSIYWLFFALKYCYSFDWYYSSVCVEILHEKLKVFIRRSVLYACRNGAFLTRPYRTSPRAGRTWPLSTHQSARPTNSLKYCDWLVVTAFKVKTVVPQAPILYWKRLIWITEWVCSRSWEPNGMNVCIKGIAKWDKHLLMEYTNKLFN